MRKFLLYSICVAIVLFSCVNGKTNKNTIRFADEFVIIDSTDATNNFYDNVETYNLPVTG